MKVKGLLGLNIFAGNRHTSYIIEYLGTDEHGNTYLNKEDAEEWLKKEGFVKSEIEVIDKSLTYISTTEIWVLPFENEGV